jgi:lysozyme
LNPYRCPAGHLTIGVGRNLEANGISKAEALAMLSNDIDRAEHDLANILQGYEIGFKQVAGPRFDALVNVCFNMGRSRLKKFRKMFAAIKAGDWDLAGKELLDSKYAKQVGRRAVELSIQLSTGRYYIDY